MDIATGLRAPSKTSTKKRDKQARFRDGVVSNRVEIH